MDKKISLSELNLSAKEVLITWQKFVLLSILLGIIIFSFTDLNMTIYWINISFNILFLLSNSYRLSLLLMGSKIHNAELHHKISFALTDEQLPTYTVLIPLFHEGRVVSSLVEAMSGLDYPKDKLQILLILEEEDTETLAVIKNMHLPEYFKPIIVPPSTPQTKAKACDYALQFATGELTCIYDAEDRPDKLQLKMAANKFAVSGKKVTAIQCRLKYYNGRENLLTSMFEIEYQALYTFILPVATYFNYPIPLGGSSNHFRTPFLIEVGAWDPYNVTEDADLGIRLALSVHRTKIIYSYTSEESPITMKAWITQRSRWIKGYFHTSFIFLRYPKYLFKEFSFGGFIFFLFVLFIGPLLMLFAPFLIALSAAIILKYFHFDPGLNLFLILFTWVNLLYAIVHFMFSSYMVANTSGHQYLRYRWVLFMFYFVLHYFAAMKSAYQLYMTPHKWDKTEHGLTKIKH